MSKSTISKPAARLQKTVLNEGGPLNTYFAAYMRQNGLTKLEELAQRAGVGATTLYDLALGKKTASGTMIRPSLETLKRLAVTLSVPAHELLYVLEPEAYGREQIEEMPAAVQIPVKVAGLAGTGPDQLTESDQEVFVEESLARGRDLVAFKIHGNSMEGGKQPIHDGAVVIVNQFDKSLDGFAVVARIQNDGYVCKKPLLGANGRLQQLVSTNLDYDDSEYRVIDPSQVQEVVGRVIRVIHDTI